MKTKPRLSDTDLKKIIAIIDGWNPRTKLSWESLVDAVETHLGRPYSRQALSRHDQIKLAFSTRKKQLRDGVNDQGYVRSLDLQKAIERIDRLEAENMRLNAEKDRLLEQFVRWLKNASDAGVSPERLNKPLTKPDREATVVRKKGG